MLPDTRRLNREDFQDAPNWIDPMLTVINAFMDSVYNIMNRNISLTQNLNIQIVAINVETDTNSDIKPVKLKTTVRGRVAGVSVIRVITTDTSSISPFVSFTQNENILTISNIASLNSNEKYKIILLVIGE